MVINLKGIYHEGKIYLSDKLPESLGKTTITVSFFPAYEENIDLNKLQLQMSEAKEILTVTVDKSLHL